MRLVKNACTVDGKATTIQAVLKDPELCKLLSDEGPIEGDFYVAPKVATTAPATTKAAPR